MGQQQNQPSLFGGQTNTAFGSSSTSGGLFGQSQQTGGLFGSSTSTQPHNTGFGAQPATSGFGSGGSLFSAQNNTANTTNTMNNSQSIFGAPKFGASTNTPFGSNTTTGLSSGMQSVVGTTIKFSPLLSNDTMVKNGVNQSINTRHQCITCMKEYENKSLEELRFEDYQANRKGPQANSMFGAATNASQPSGGLFSSTSTPSVSFNNNTGGSLFGQSKPAFGAPTTTTSTTSIFGNSAFGANKPFGSSTPAFGTSTQTTQPTSVAGSGSLFGASTSTTSTFGQQNTGLFGMNNTNPTANKPFFTATTNAQPSLFSNTTTTNNMAAKPLFGTPGSAGTTNAFGAVSTPASSFSFTGGNTIQPSAATSVGLFSNTQTTSLFGTGNAVAQNAASKPLFNFSSTPSGLGGTANPLAGSAANAGTSLFNTGTALGANTLGGGGSLFGASNTGTSLFGNNSGLSAGLSANALGQSNMLQMQPLQANQSLAAANPSITTSSSDHLMTRLLVLPYGTSPLFQNQTQSSAGSASLKFTTDPKTLNQYKVNFSTNTSSASGKSVRIPNSNNNRNTALLFEDYEDVSLNEKKTAADIFVPRKSIKKLIIRPKEELEKSLISSPVSLQTSSQPVSNKTAPAPLEVSSPISVDKQNPLDTTVMEFYRKGQAGNDSIVNAVASSSPVVSSARSGTEASGSPSTFAPVTSAPASSPDSHKSLSKSPVASSPAPQPSSDLSGNYSQNYSLLGPSELGSPSAHFTPCSPVKQYKCRVICTRPNYFTIPSLEQLDTLVNEQQQVCLVDNFTVGRHDYGTIFWEGPLDVYGLNIDEVVHIRRKEVIVYPDDSNKAQLGSGLNRPAQITLHKVWPVDKATRELIKDSERLERMGYEEKIELATIKFGGIFKEYRPDTGSWVFCVKHFSKYGLLDDDDEEEAQQGQQFQQPADTRTHGFEPQPFYPVSKSSAFTKNNSDLFASGKSINYESTRQQHPYRHSSDFGAPVKDIDSFGYGEDESRYVGSFRPPVSGAYNQNHHLFAGEDVGDEDEEGDDQNEFSMNKHPTASMPDVLIDPVDTGYFASLRNALFDAPPEDKPFGPNVKKTKKLLLIPDVFSKNDDYMEENGELDAYPTPPTRCSIAVKLNLVVKRELPFDDLPAFPTAECHRPVNDIGSLKFTPFPKIRFFSGGNRFLLIRGRQVQVHSIQLLTSFDAHTVNRFEHQLVENSIVSSCEPVSTYVQSKATIANPHNDERLERLIRALYSRLDIREHSSYDSMRTNLILDWLCEQNLLLSKPTDSYLLILHYLAGNDVHAAGEVALRTRQPKLMMMLACGSMFDCKTNIQQQLTKWRTNQLDRFIDAKLLRVYVLLSGEIRYRLSTGDEIDVLEGLEWTQQLALLLLYSIHEGLQHCIKRLTCITDDVEYHLIAGNSPLVAMSATRNDLESWFLHQSLQSYGVIDVSINSNVAHGTLAAQLLPLPNGIRWACFVAMHINDDLLRDHTIRELLLLHIPMLTRSDETWLQSQLLLPKHFVAEAKAIHAKARFQHAQLALQQLECERWSDAHETLLEFIFPELVINDENEKLRSLLNQLKPHKESISGWYPAGAHIYDVYCQCVQDDQMDEHLLGEPFDFNQMKATNVRQVLCQSEMARKFNLVHHAVTGDRFILNMPVPNDYALSEVKSNFHTLLKKWSI